MEQQFRLGLERLVLGSLELAAPQQGSRALAPQRQLGQWLLGEMELERG